MSAARNALLARPQWIISNSLTMPLLTFADNGKNSVRGLVSVVIPFTIFLDTLFSDKVNVFSTGRSIERDQYQVFKSIEGALQTTGINGKACLLRTICEMQMSDIGQLSLAGELIAVLLSPKKNFFSDFLHEYMEAEHMGRSKNASCSSAYPLCPVSLFKLFQMQNLPSHDDPSSSVDANSPSAEHQNQGTAAEATSDPNIANHQHSHQWVQKDFLTISTEHPSVEENIIE